MLNVLLGPRHLETIHPAFETLLVAKHDRGFACLDRMANGELCLSILEGSADHPRLTQTVPISASKIATLHCHERGAYLFAPSDTDPQLIAVNIDTGEIAATHLPTPTTQPCAASGGTWLATSRWGMVAFSLHSDGVRKKSTFMLEWPRTSRKSFSSLALRGQRAVQISSRDGDGIRWLDIGRIEDIQQGGWHRGKTNQQDELVFVDDDAFVAFGTHKKAQLYQMGLRGAIKSRGSLTLPTSYRRAASHDGTLLLYAGSANDKRGAPSAQLFVTNGTIKRLGDANLGLDVRDVLVDSESVLLAGDGGLIRVTGRAH